MEDTRYMPHAVSLTDMCPSMCVCDAMIQRENLVAEHEWREYDNIMLSSSCLCSPIFLRFIFSIVFQSNRNANDNFNQKNR